MPAGTVIMLCSENIYQPFVRTFEMTESIGKFGKAIGQDKVQQCARIQEARQAYC